LADAVSRVDALGFALPARFAAVMTRETSGVQTNVVE
jgi:hypothetical protein